MRSSLAYFGCLVSLLVIVAPSIRSFAEPATTPATQPSLANPLGHADEFPIAVWLQNPRDAKKYKALGVNLYVGLWKGPTEEQLAALEKAHMPVICHQNELALQNLDRKIIVGWMHGDEPDNAQPLPGGKGYGQPIPPADVQADYHRIQKADPTRPILLNLGQGVAWDGWPGRGARSNKPEDYPDYIKGADIVSFDIYPATHERTQVAGKLWMVAGGVDRLIKWSGNQKIVWNCIETTHINNKNTKPTPKQVRAEVWMSIIAGSRGIIYFCHEFAPTRNSAALLADKEMSAAVKGIDAQIASLAPAINAPAMKSPATVTSSDANVPIALMTRRDGDDLCIFAVSMRDGATTADFSLPDAPAGIASVEVIGEDRTIPLKAGHWSDPFDSFDVHLYRIKTK